MRRTHSLLLALTVVNGCALSEGVEVAWSAPPMVLDVDAERAALEGALCADAAASGCTVLTALDDHDGLPSADGAPALPALMPRTIDMRAAAKVGFDVPSEVLDVAGWLDTQRREVRDFMPEIALPFHGIDAEQIGGTHIVDASLRFDDDTLAIDLPPFDIYVDDARIGVIGAHAGGSGDVAPLSFVAGGVAALEAALANGGSARLVAPESTADVLQSVGDELRRPGGSASLVLDLRIELSTSRALEEINGTGNEGG